jgi:hypothetical protein
MAGGREMREIKVLPEKKVEKKVVLKAHDLRRICKKIADDVEFIITIPSYFGKIISPEDKIQITGVSRVFEDKKMLIALHAERMFK